MSVLGFKEWFETFETEPDGAARASARARAQGRQHAPGLTNPSAERIAERARAYQDEQHRAGNHITTAEAVRHVMATEANPELIAARANAYQQKQREYGNVINASEAVRHVEAIEKLRDTLAAGAEVDAAMVAELAKFWQGRAASLGMLVSSAELGARLPE